MKHKKKTIKLIRKQPKINDKTRQSDSWFINTYVSLTVN